MSIPFVHAAPQYTGIFSILNDKNYTENASDIKGVVLGVPNITWQQSGDIEGWIDIEGFRDMLRENGIDYVPGNPADYAIVQYNAKFTTPMVMGSIGLYLCQSCTVDYIKHNIHIYTDGNQTVAKDDIELKWTYHWTDYDGYQYATSHIEHATFQASKVSPKQYPVLKEPVVVVTQYNNSMYENIGIKISGDNYTKVSFKYLDKQADRTLQILHVENNSEGIVYGNTTELDQWDIKGTGISRFYNEILLDGNLSKMDVDEFDIRVYNPFGNMKANPENFTIRRVEFAPQKNMNALLIAVIGMVSTFTVGTLYLFNRTLSKWRINLF